MPLYRQGATPTTDDIQSLQRFLRIELQGVENSDQLLALWTDFIGKNYVLSAYGGMALSGAASLGDISTAPQVIPFDVEAVPTPRGIDVDQPASALVFGTVGVYRVTGVVNLEFAPAPLGRRIALQLFDETAQTTIGNPVAYHVASNQGGVNLTYSALLRVPGSVAGNVITMRILSDTDTFTGVTVIGGTWEASNAAQYQGTFFERTEGARSKWQ